MVIEAQLKSIHMKIGIIGSNGFLGSYLKEKVLINKFDLVKISFRNKKNEKLLKFFKFNFKKIDTCDFLINCCAVKSPINKYDFFINSKLPGMIQNYINRKKLKCKLIHISTINILFDFLDDSYTKQKKIAEKSIVNGFLTIRPGLIWDYNGVGDSRIFKKYLNMPLPFYLMVNSGNFYRPVCPNALSELIINNIKNQKYFDELNVLGNKVLSLFELFKRMASFMNKTVIPINSIFLFWIKFITTHKHGSLYTLSQQINNFDRTGDKLKLKNIIYLKFEI